ncbi:MAG: RDD family protein [Erythrobacter sp.]
MTIPAASVPVGEQEPPAPASNSRANNRARTLITPEGIAVPITVASRASRFGALLLDFVILYFSLILFVILFYSIAGSLLDDIAQGAEENVKGAGAFMIIVIVLVMFLARYFYFMGLELGPRGATLGKRIVGIRVAARDGGRLTPEAVIARNLVRDIELFMPFVFLTQAPSGQMGNFGLAGLVWFMVIVAIPLLNKDRLRAGDIIAGTWVVDAPRTKLADAISTMGAATASSESNVTGQRYQFGDEELSIYGEHELQTLERVLREGQDDAVISVHDAICHKVGWDPGSGDERAFLEAFYAQLRAKLEGDMRFGKRKADKHA